MNSSGPCAGALIVVALGVASVAVAQACGYEDPTQVNRGALALVYPKALYVMGAVAMAQQDGIVGHDVQPQATRRLLGYQRAVGLLDRFRKRLAGVLGGSTPPPFSMVFIEPMLWSRYEAAAGATRMTPHLAGPNKGDVVIVTDERVVAAIMETSLSPAKARDLGLMRLYGSSERVAEVTNWLDRVADQQKADSAMLR